MKLNAPSMNWLIAVTAGLVITGCASVERQATPAIADRPKPGKGLVTFYRERRLVGMAVGFNIRDNGTKIGGLPNGCYFVYDAAPGSHLFSGATEIKSERGINVEPGRSYYVRGEIEMGLVVGRPNLTIVDPQEGSAAIRDLRRVTLSR